jgi:hypothetical protein
MMMSKYLGTADAHARRDLTNRKPYRTKAQRKIARETAVKCKDGAYRSTAPVSYHPGASPEA